MSAQPFLAMHLARLAAAFSHFLEECSDGKKTCQANCRHRIVDYRFVVNAPPVESESPAAGLAWRDLPPFHRAEQKATVGCREALSLRDHGEHRSYLYN